MWPRRIYPHKVLIEQQQRCGGSGSHGSHAQSVGAVQQSLAVSSLECSDCHSTTAAWPGHCWKSRVSQRVPCKQRQSSTHGVSCHQHPGTAGPAHPGHPRVSFETFSQPAWLHTRIPVIQPQPATCACFNYSYRGHSTVFQCELTKYPLINLK